MYVGSIVANLPLRTRALPDLDTSAATHKEVEENKKILKQMVKREEAEDHLTEVQRLQQVLREEKSRTAQIKVSFVFEFVSGLCAKFLHYYSLCMFAVLLIEYY